jgi:hypothetical protein
VAWNIVGLLVTALAGAGLVHFLAYHIPLAVPFDPRWAATALDLVNHCPHGSPLSAVAIIALLTLLLVRYELRRLDRLDAALARCLTAHRVPVPAGHEIVPRSPCRLFLLTIVLLGLQVAALGIYDLCYPMRMTMVMNGAPMTMPMAPVLPLAPVHLVVAALLGLVLWRVERRLTRLRAQIAGRLTALIVAGGTEDAAARWRRVTLRPLAWSAPTLFARPPPSVA